MLMALPEIGRYKLRNSKAGIKYFCLQFINILIINQFMCNNREGILPYKILLRYLRAKIKGFRTHITMC